MKEETSLKELVLSLLDNLNKRMDDLKKDLKENTDYSRQLVLQLGQLEGRVVSQEQWSREAKSIIEANAKSASDAKEGVRYVVGKRKSDNRVFKVALGIVVFFMVGFTTMAFTIAENNLRDDSQKQISSQVSQAVTQALAEQKPY